MFSNVFRKYTEMYLLLESNDLVNVTYFIAIKMNGYCLEATYVGSSYKNSWWNSENQIFWSSWDLLLESKAYFELARIGTTIISIFTSNQARVPISKIE